MIGVVIPYYQAHPGILARSLRSVFQQKGIDNLKVFIVDDESPVPAASELETLKERPRFTVEIINQKNAGPGAARNKALDNLSSDIDFVAFLDSDDEWFEEHLKNGLAALRHGYDFYFADHYQLGQTVGAFGRARRLDPSDHPLIEGSTHLHEYRGDMFDQILRGNVIGTSTVIYDFHRFPAVRFRPEFRHAGEDYLMWMEFSRSQARFAFSSECEARYGKGVNLYSGSGWGTQSHALRLQNEMQYRKVTRSDFNLTFDQDMFLRKKIAELRKQFVADLLHRIVHRKGISARLMFAQLKLDPMTFLLFLPIAARMLSKKKLMERNELSQPGLEGLSVVARRTGN